MPVAYFVRRRSRRLSVRAISVTLLLLTGVLSVFPHAARSRVEYQPLDIAAEEVLVPGEPLDCRIELEGSPAEVTVYSDPPGAVSYNGTVDQAVTTVEATTSATISSPTESVTLYLVTDGATSVATEISSEHMEEPVEPAAP